ncbi:MAG: PTS sugar transporter subunit IIB [Candidatus Krumholzibacteriia bacterium]
MKLVLARIDDRLIHGQVTVGWGHKLNPDHIVLACDEVALDPWQARVYAMSVPPQVAVSVMTVAEAARLLGDPDRADLQDRRVMLLTGSPRDMQRLVAAGVPVRQVNVGGMHYARGKRELVPDIYVDRDDLLALRSIGECGLELLVQAVPGGQATALEPAQLRALEDRL